VVVVVVVGPYDGVTLPYPPRCAAGYSLPFFIVLCKYGFMPNLYYITIFYKITLYVDAVCVSAFYHVLYVLSDALFSYRRHTGVSLCLLARVYPLYCHL